MRTSLMLAAALAAGLYVHPSAAQECAPQDEGDFVSNHRLLRQLALDLLGRIPTMEEWRRLEAGASIDEEFLPEFLESEEYYGVVREQHRALLWGSLGNIDNVSAGGWIIGPLAASAGGMWRAGNLRRTFRGVNTFDCLDQLQTEFDAMGRPVPIQVSHESFCDDPDGAGPLGRECRREGYVMVDPWWDRGNPIKVCAYDAQALATGKNTRTCSEYNVDAYCGCGPNLRYCMSSSNRAGQREIRTALEEEPARIFEGVIREHRSYLEAFTTRETWVNGATSHFYRFQTGIAVPTAGGQIVYDDAVGDVPSIAFSALDDWQRVERREGHAGVLTTTGYLLRFASNRARANRFYTAFRCEPFVPPAEGLPEETEATPHPNLRERTGCRSCHETLEPVAATWGRWRTNGTHGFLDLEIMDFDEPLAACTGCGGTNEDGTSQRNCSAFCNAYYVTGANADERERAEWDGLPLARAWLTSEEAPAIETGPASLVDEEGEIRRVASCTVRTVAERLLGRDLSQTESLHWVPAMTDEFAAAGYDYSGLVESVVSSEVYRTIR